jgi:hypothetical protein
MMSEFSIDAPSFWKTLQRICKRTKIIMSHYLAYLILCCVVMTSCSKQFDKTSQQSLQVTTNDFKNGATGVTLSQATQLALHFLQTKSPNKNITIKNAVTIDKNGTPYFHIINANKGFVIVSPDSNYVPILAYDSLGNFSYATQDLNPGLIMWFNKHAYELDYVRSHHDKLMDSIAKVNRLLWIAFGSVANNNLNIVKQQNGAIPNVTPPVLIGTQPAPAIISRSTVGPLCPTFWGQDYPFNYYCPTDGSAPNGYLSRDAAGCVPLAMAQVMYFWGINNPSRFPKYNWASMPLTKYAYGFLPAANDCPRLIHDIGVQQITVLITIPPNGQPSYETFQFVNYGSAAKGGSSADDANCPYVFSKFGFTSASRTQDIAGQILTGDDDGLYYERLLSNEIQTNHWPCLLGGYSSNGFLGLIPSGSGHEWVCDGSDVTTVQTGTTYEYKDFWGKITYQTYYTNTTVNTSLHMNWGWESLTGETGINGIALSNNGWYNADVNYSQADGTSPNFQYYQTVIHNIH